MESGTLYMSVSTHQSSVVLFLGIMLIFMLLNNAGKAAGIGGRAGKVLSLGDGWCPATHRQTTHLDHSDLTKTCFSPYAEFIQAAQSYLLASTSSAVRTCDDLLYEK